MQKTFQLIVAVFLFLLMAFPVHAEKPNKSWSDEAELSFVDTGGNTDVTTLSAKNTLKYNFSEKLVGIWKLGVLYGETDGDKTAEQYYTELRGDYHFSERWYGYINGGWLKDTFAGIDPRYYGGAGMGYKILNGPKHILLGEMGLNYTTEEYTDGTDADYLGGRVYGLYEYHFTEKNKFSQSLEWLEDFDDTENWTLTAETALVSSLTDILSLKASYLFKNDNQPTDELDEIDTILGVAIVVNY